MTYPQEPRKPVYRPNNSSIPVRGSETFNSIDSNRDVRPANKGKKPFKAKAQKSNEPKIPFDRRFDTALDTLSDQYKKCIDRADMILIDKFPTPNTDHQYGDMRLDLASTLFINTLMRAGQLDAVKDS